MPPPKAICIVQLTPKLLRARPYLRKKEYPITNHVLLHLRCVIKPCASPAAAGVQEVSDTAVKVAVTPPPVEDASNRALILLLSELLDVPKTDVDITKGRLRREKLVEVVGKTGAMWGGEKRVKKMLLGEVLPRVERFERDPPSTDTPVEVRREPSGPDTPLEVRRVLPMVEAFKRDPSSTDTPVEVGKVLPRVEAFERDPPSTDTPVEVRRDPSGPDTPVEVRRDPSSTDTPVEAGRVLPRVERFERDPPSTDTPVEFRRDSSSADTPVEVRRDSSSTDTPVEVGRVLPRVERSERDPSSTDRPVEVRRVLRHSPRIRGVEEADVRPREPLSQNRELKFRSVVSGDHTKLRYHVSWRGNNIPRMFLADSPWGDI